MIIQYQIEDEHIIIKIIDDFMNGEPVGIIIGCVNCRFGIITWLQVCDKYKGHGFGITLIKKFLKKISEIGIIHVELDDCSDNYRKDHNIYIKCGFKYIDNNNRMYSNVRVSLKKINNFL